MAKFMAHEPKTSDAMCKAPPLAYRRADALAKAQVVLPVLALLAAVGFGVAEWLAHGDARYSPGSLASVHTQWDNQCAACHDSSRKCMNPTVPAVKTVTTVAASNPISRLLNPWSPMPSSIVSSHG